jgi:hypothetical protein
MSSRRLLIVLTFFPRIASRGRILSISIKTRPVENGQPRFLNIPPSQFPVRES